MPIPLRAGRWLGAALPFVAAMTAFAQAGGPERLVGFRDATRLVVVSKFDVEIWDVTANRIIHDLDIDPAFSATERVLSPDARLLAMHRFLRLPLGPGMAIEESDLHDTRLLDVDSGNEIRLTPVNGRPAGLAFSTDGTLLIRLTMQDAHVAFDIWRVPSGDRIAGGNVAMSDARPSTVAISQAGDRFAIAMPAMLPSTTGRITIHEAQSGRVMETIDATATGILFSADGRLLHFADTAAPPVYLANPARVIGARSSDRTIFVQDPSTGDIVRTVQLDANPVSMAVSRDGRLIAAGTTQGVHVFEMVNPDLLAPVLSANWPRQPGTRVPAGRFGTGAYYPGGALSNPVPTRRPHPSYTQEALQAKIQGTVLLEMVVREDGTPGDVRVVRSLDRQFGLDDAAVSAARNWRFTPARDATGRPVSVLINVELEFLVREPASPH